MGFFDSLFGSPETPEEKELKETIALWQEVRKAWLDSNFSDELIREAFVRVIFDEVEHHLPIRNHLLRAALARCLFDVVSREKYAFSFPEFDWQSKRFTPQEVAAIRREVEKVRARLAQIDTWISALTGPLTVLVTELLSAAEAVGANQLTGLFTVRLIELLPQPGYVVGSFKDAMWGDEARALGLFKELERKLADNVCKASGLSLADDISKKRHLVVMPELSPLPPLELAVTYLHDTPFLDLMMTPVPLTMPLQTRFEHTHVLAGSGHGKTQTLQHLIMSDLEQKRPPALIIIDSQGEMIDKLSRLRGQDDPIIIDPRDTPALNLFDVDFDRLSHYGPMYREQILNGVIELYDYLFGSLLGAELTQKQSVIFRYLARLLLTIPGATILTLIELLTDEKPYQKYIQELPAGARLFFETEFPHKSFTDTKRQIQRRLWGILENPTFERMMTAPKNRVNMFDALQGGRVVLVNTAKDFLKAERSSFLGRFFIALTLQAVLERAALPEGNRRPAFLYIDEAADYFDSNIDDLLTQARKYKLGVVFAHQYLDQLAPGLRSSIASNTSIKFAGGVSDRDARSLAPDMRTTPTVIMGQRKQQDATQFACYIRNTTPHALSVSVPFGTLERQKTRSDEDYLKLRERNRRAVCTEKVAAEEKAAAPEAPKAPAHDPDDIDTAAGKW